MGDAHEQGDQKLDDVVATGLDRGIYVLQATDFHAKQILSVVVPVLLTMVVSVWTVNFLTTYDLSGSATDMSHLLVYRESSSDSSGEKFGGSLLNALAVAAGLFIITFVMYIMYKKGCVVIIYGWLLLSVGFLVAVSGGYMIYMLAQVVRIPLDLITYLFLLWNLTIGAEIAVFYHAPKIATSASLVGVSIIMSYSLSRLPEWTTWSMLMVVAFYDIGVVLAPCGPLKGMVEEAEKRQQNIPGLVYTGEEVRLGLGDFIFYSTLVGRASMHGWSAGFVAMVAVIMGLCLTLFILSLVRKPLPALPISIILGVIFYMMGRFFLSDYTDKMASVPSML